MSETITMVVAQGGAFTETTTTGGALTAVADMREPAFPWHWPPNQRRMFVEIIEAAERRAARRPSDTGPGREP